MVPYLKSQFGNPSSSHAHGRQARVAIEEARKSIAGLLHASPAEIFFTSGGTEADNTAINTAVSGMGVKHVITSRLEHHAVLNTLKSLEKRGEIQLSFVQHDSCGNINLAHLELLLKPNDRSFVSIMHGNNEIGNLNDIEAIGEICKQYKALFHTDTVQTVGHYQIDLAKLNVHFLAGSAHKFHGPKGVGFLYVKNPLQVTPLIHGGSQERHVRAGTENVAGIIGLATALTLSCQRITEDRRHIENLKRCCIQCLQNEIPGVQFNGNSSLTNKSLYTVLSVSLPSTGNDLLGHLDANGISASGGSACTSASHSASHVLSALQADLTRQTLRLSFSKYNSVNEIDFLLEKLNQVYKAEAVA
jgi:cysteine desulfurase